MYGNVQSLLDSNLKFYTVYCQQVLLIYKENPLKLYMYTQNLEQYTVRP